MVARLAASQACSGPSGAIILFVYLLIAISQLVLRQRTAPDKLVVKMWFHPVLSIATIVGIVAVLVGMYLEDAGVTRRLVETLQVGGLEHEVVVQAHAGLTLTFFDADQDYIDSISLLPGWARYGGWPYDARLLTPAAVSTILTELGVSLPWSSAALRAVDDVEPNFPAAGRKGAGVDDAEHASARAGRTCSLNASTRASLGSTHSFAWWLITRPLVSSSPTRS